MCRKSKRIYRITIKIKNTSLVGLPDTRPIIQKSIVFLCTRNTKMKMKGKMIQFTITSKI